MDEMDDLRRKIREEVDHYRSLPDHEKEKLYRSRRARSIAVIDQEWAAAKELAYEDLPAAMDLAMRLAKSETNAEVARICLENGTIVADYAILAMREAMMRGTSEDFRGSQDASEP